MSLGWSRRALVDTLVGTDAAIDFTIPLSELPRVSRELTSTDGDATGRARFSRQLGQAVADLEVSARPEVVCQRCMQAMCWQVDVKSRIALVSDYDAADRVSEGLEVFLVEGDSVSVRDLVDEEILLALPNVALHAEGSECADGQMQLSATEADEEDVADSQVQKPFAQLGELLKRK